MKKIIALICILLTAHKSFCWGFYAHRKINQYAVFLLPPEMMILYKPYIGFLEEHAVDPDKRRYAIPEEGPRHYIDIDQYGVYPYDSLPRKWNEAVANKEVPVFLCHQFGNTAFPKTMNTFLIGVLTVVIAAGMQGHM